MQKGLEPSTAAASQLGDVAERARGYMARSRATNTVRAYRSDWTQFQRWCREHRLQELPASPATVALYISDVAGTVKCSTLQRRLTAIAAAHRAAGYTSPTTDVQVETVWEGIRRTHGTAQQGKQPATTAEIRAMVQGLPSTLKGIRDRALLLVGFAGALRRSELVALDAGDVAFTRDGLVVTLRRSKTDQVGEGREIGIPYGSDPSTCPVRALEAWIRTAGIDGGSLFRSVDRHGRLQPGRLCDRAVALVVKATAAAAGLDPERFSGHSLRSGLATSAAAAGAPERAIMAQTGHRSVTTLRKYIRLGSLFQENAAATVGL